MNKNDHKEKDSGNFTVFIAISCLVLILTIGMTFVIGFYADEVKRGTFGDMFGFANALFTGLSFIGLIITILLQRKDLNIQRKELQKQTDSIHIQNFENTFFQMLNLFNSVIDSTEITGTGHTLFTSRKAFDYIAKYHENELIKIANDPVFFNTILKSQRTPDKKKTIDYLQIKNINEAYSATYKKYQNVLGHYFRTYYHVIKLIDKTDIIDKLQYISIARAQLSNSEQVLLFYNCLHENGNEKFKPLVEKYSLLHNINSEEMPSIHHEVFYKKSAYDNKYLYS